MNLAEDTWLHCTSKTAQTIRFYCNLQLTRDMIVIRAHNLPLGARTNRIDYVIKLVLGVNKL